MNTYYRKLVFLMLAFAAACGDSQRDPDSTCTTPTTDCGGTCRNLRTDPASCGACGTTCDADQVCAAGACLASCPVGTTTCGASCIDTATDVTNCGACGTVCSTAHGTATCVAGSCGVAACDDGSYGSEGACHTCTAIAGCTTESCTTAFDAACLACEPGSYLSGNTCVTCSGACAGGSYQTAACTATADRTCGGCTAISGCANVTCTSATDSTCTTCPSGSYLAQNTCHTCSTESCAAGSYETAACSTTADRTCGACTAIPGCADEVCTGATDATCQACAPGSYLSGNTCVTCSGACATGTYETAACSATADRTCGCTPIAGCTAEVCSTATDATCQACAPGSYLSGNTCVACSGACATGTYETAACSATADRTCGCTPIAGCTTEVCSTATDTTCQACAPGSYLSGNTCVACSGACATGTYETAACSATADRTCGCTPIAGCTDEACTTATDQTCIACAPGSYLSGNTCVTCSTDCPTGTYETAACSATADRTCGCTAIADCTTEVCSTATDQTCTGCGAGHYVSGGTCATCSACPAGHFEETACGGSADVTCGALDCYALHAADPTLTDGVYSIDPDGPGGGAPFGAYCDMTTGGGGWTLVMKVDGSLTTFTYDSPLWTNATPYQPESSAFDTVTETKSPAFSTMPFNAMRFGMFDPTDSNTRWLEVARANSSLLELFTSGYQALSEGRDAWKGLLATPSLQPYCNMEGFNVDAAYNVAARIGIVSNQENDCGSPDSRIGIGTKGDNCGQNTNHSSGDEAKCDGDHGDVSVATFGYVMVRNCPGGVCACPAPTTSCDAICVDTDSDQHHCGACGNFCGQQNAADACVAGTCEMTCNPGWTDCDGSPATGCEANLDNDAANCGACGNTCATGLTCISGTCLDTTSLQIDNPNHRVVEYLPKSDFQWNAPAQGTCTSDCKVYPTNGDMGGVRLRSATGFASGCDWINRRGQCIVYLPAHVVLN